jgi:hypothetical protein
MTSKAAMLRGHLVSRRSFVVTLAAAAAAPAAQAQGRPGHPRGPRVDRKEGSNAC